MRIEPFSLITVANACGPEMDQGSALRYLAEIIWFPTAWLSDYIRWQAIDAHSVRAIIYEPHVTVSAVPHVNEPGQPMHFTTDRFMEEHGGYRLTPWSGQSNEFQEVDGMRTPTKIEVTWHLASGEFSYFRCKITEIEYNFHESHSRIDRMNHDNVADTHKGGNDADIATVDEDLDKYGE